MNFIQQLMTAPVKPAPKKAPATVQANQRKSIRGKYRLYLEGQRRTVSDLAELIGVSYSSAHAMVGRLEADGLVIEDGSKTTTGGKAAAIYTWKIGGAA